jgi:hypothetical protein
MVGLRSKNMRLVVMEDSSMVVGKRRENDQVTVLRIRDVYPGSRVRIFSIPDPGSKIFRIPDPDPHQRIYLSIINPNNCF